MSREGLVPQLQARGIQVKEMKYGQQSVSVYQGTFQNYAVAIKVLALSPGADHAQLEKECNTLMSLSHPNILRLYTCFWENNGVSYFFVIVTEWCEKDLAKDMKQRAENNFPWREEELWSLTFELVSALAYMQMQDMSHRDIKPENIFLTLTKSAKMGDFGSARTFQSDIEAATLTGTPFYLSPKLREALLNRIPQVVHNSFKSDVYSLGLTLLSLSLLAPPLSLAKENVSNEEVQLVIRTVIYSDLFKSMLTWMLTVDEEKRCDFKALGLWLEAEYHRPILPLDPTTVILPGVVSTDPLPQTVAIQPNIIPSISKLKSTVALCMKCQKAVNRDSEVAEYEVVQLYCEPALHMFCSRECCRSYLLLDSPKCPQCGAEIPEETVEFYLSDSKEKPAQYTEDRSVEADRPREVARDGREEDMRNSRDVHVPTQTWAARLLGWICSFT